MTLPSVDDMKGRMTDEYWVTQTLSNIENVLLQADPMDKHIVFSLGSVPNSKRGVVETALVETLTNLGYEVRKVVSNHSFVPSFYIGWGK